MRRKIEYATAIFLLAVQAFGCSSDEVMGTHQENEPPEVWLAIGPPEGSVTDYRVHLYWGGWDPDGKIAYFEWSLTNNETGVFNPADTVGADKWHRTTEKDSVFLVSADFVADSSTLDTQNRSFEFRRSHTFFIRAVDEEGLDTSEPVYRSFTARNISPDIFVTTPKEAVGLNPAIMPPVVTFEWVGRDDESKSMEPDSARFILLKTADFGNDWEVMIQYVRDNPRAPEWSAWRSYADPDTGKSWTPPEALAFGGYLFAVQAMDEAGAVSPVFDFRTNVRRIIVTGSISGPIVEVQYRYMRNIVTAAPDTPPAIMDLPAGLPIGFAFSADASSYGGTVTGYRYGWDILDLNDPEQWEISFTPFVGSTATSPTRQYFFGTHTFFLEVIDNNGLTTRVTVVINIVPFTMERSLLIVDDWAENSPGFKLSRGLSPSDEENDEFWADMAAHVGGFAPGRDIFQAEHVEELPIHILASYGAVVWNAIGSPNAAGPTASILNKYLNFVLPGTEYRSDSYLLPNILRMYMAVGGKVLICGTNVMSVVINRNLMRANTYPLIYRYEMTGNQSGASGPPGVGENGFAYSDCCLNVVDVSFTAPSGLRRTPADCSVLQVRDRSQRTDGLRECMPIDETYAFPPLSLRPEAAGIARFFNENNAGLPTDLYNPPYFTAICNRLSEQIPQRSCFQPIYGHGCLNTSSAIYGAPVAFWTGTYADRTPPNGVRGRSAVFGFAPVYFNPDEVQKAMEIIFFDEWKLQRL